MNTGGHPTFEGAGVQDDHLAPEAALAELRRQLQDRLAGARLSKSQLAVQAGLSRTTVYEALQAGRSLPSAETVAALARVLKLPVDELLAMRRRAAEPRVLGSVGSEAGPGRPLSAWDPHDLEVHPAGVASCEGAVARERRVLPGYVPRRHDLVLADAVRDAAAGRSRMLVLVGTSSTGKTRACWEAVQRLADDGWRLWHPFAPGRAEAALTDLYRVAPRTVVWLNEAQHYLGDSVHGERIAAAVHHLLTSPERAPVLVLGTLWPEYASQYTALPKPGRPDPHSLTRELLSARRVPVPHSFDNDALNAARVLAQAGDVLLADALSRAAEHGGVTQDLAGAPELLRRYEDGSPAARAILHAAMDAHRLGIGLHLPQAFLTDAALGYLSDVDYQQLDGDWAEAAYAELAQPVHGKQAPLSRVRPRLAHSPLEPPSVTEEMALTAEQGQLFQLADYLAQYGRTQRRTQCPPVSFWHAAHTHLTSGDDLDRLADAAGQRHRLQWEHHLRRQAAETGCVSAQGALAVQQEEAGDRVRAEAFAWRAAAGGDFHPLSWLAAMREEAGDRRAAEALARRAADAGSTRALFVLAMKRDNVWDHEAANALAQLAADAGDFDALYKVAESRKNIGQRKEAETLLQRAAAAGSIRAVCGLAALREKAGDREEAETLLLRAADAGSTDALHQLALMQGKAGEHEAAEAVALRAAAAGDSSALRELTVMRERAGDRAEAEALAQRAADAGDSGDALFVLASLRHLEVMKLMEEDGEGANDLAQRTANVDDLAQRAADAGNLHAMYRLAEMCEEEGDHAEAEALAQRAADAGITRALGRLAELREEAGDHAGAEILAQRAADAGDLDVVSRLVQMREEAGDYTGAEALAQQAADAGNLRAQNELVRMQDVAEDQVRAQALLLRIADTGNSAALYRLARMREKTGDLRGAQALLLRAVDAGGNLFMSIGEWSAEVWPHGLDPDSTPTDPWS